MALDLVARLRLQDDLSGKMNRATRSMQGAEKRTRSLTSGFSKLGGVLAGLGVATGMAAIGKSVIQTGIDFSTTMSKVQAVSGATGEEMEKLSAQARELGKSTIHSATQAADAQAFLGQAGFKTNEILATMPGLLDLATAGQLDLGRAADIASNVMTGFNLKAEDMGRIADVLAQAAANANTDVEQMGMAMSYIAPIASAMGVSLEEVAAGIGMLSNAGIQGERAGTAMRGVIGALGDPTKALARQLGRVGLSVEDVNPKVNSLADILQNLKDSGLTAADAIELVGLNAGPGLASLMTAGPEALREFTGEMENAGGAAKTMANIISDNLGADIKLFKSAQEEANLQIFDKIGERLRGVIKTATKAVEKIPALVDKVMELGAAFKPLGPLLKPVGKALLIFGGAVLAVGAVAGTITAIGLALGFLVSPLGLIALAITGAVLGFQAFYNNSETFRGAVESVVSAMKGFYEMFTGERRDAVEQFLKAGLSGKQIDQLYEFKAQLDQAIGGIVGSVKGLYQAFTGDNAGALNTWLDSGFNTEQIQRLFAFSGGLTAALDKIKETYNNFKKAFSEGGTVGLAQALGLSPEAIGSITNVLDNVKSAFESIKTSVTNFITAVQPGIETLLGAFKGFGTTLMSVFTTLWNVLAPVFTGIAVAFGIIADVAQMVFNNIIVPAVTHAIDIFQLLWKVVGPVLDLLGAAIELNFNILKIVWDTILSPFVNFMTGLFKTSLELAAPIIEKLGGAFDKVGGFISGVTDLLRTFSKILSSVKVPEWINTIGGKISGAAGAVGKFLGGGPAKSHYHGIDRVAKDGHRAILHKGERVLTRREADAYDRMQMPDVGASFRPAPISNVINFDEKKRERESYSGMDYEAASASVSNDNRSYNYGSSDKAKNEPTNTFTFTGDFVISGESGDSKLVARDILTEIATLIEREGAQMA